MAQSQENTQTWLQKSPNEAVADLRGTLNKMIPDFENILQHLPVGLMIQDIINAVAKNPKLLRCTKSSILRCAIMAVQLELRIDTAQQHAHMVPFYNSQKKRSEAQFMPGYRGLIRKALENPELGSIEARCVFNGEEFDLDFGVNQILVHKPDLTGEAAALSDKLQENLDKFIGCYAIARMKPDRNGVEPPPLIEWMSKTDILGIRGKAKASTGPWYHAKDFFQMARKTVIKRIFNYLSSGPGLMVAVDLENQASMGEPQIMAKPDNINTDVFGEEHDLTEPEPTKTDKVAGDLKEKAKANKEPAPKKDPEPPPAEPTGPEQQKAEADSKTKPPDPEPPAKESEPEPAPPEPDEPTEPAEPSEPEPPAEPPDPAQPAEPPPAGDGRRKRNTATAKKKAESRDDLAGKLLDLLIDKEKLLGEDIIAQFDPDRISKWGEKALGDSVTYIEGLIKKKEAAQNGEANSG